MRAYIHGFQGKAYNSDCQAAYDGFKALGIEPVLFTTNEEFDTRMPEDVVVGGTIMIWHALNQRGIQAEHYDYPEELSAFRGRRIWQTRLGDIRHEKLPIFIKPVEEKIAPGIVVEKWEDLEAEYGLLGPETLLYCSEPVEFVSEWRCFLLYGKIVGIQFYYGDHDAVYDRETIDAAVCAYPNMPAGCALDLLVTKNRYNCPIMWYNDIMDKKMIFLAALAVVVIMNIAAFVLMGHDKRCARQGKWRVPEKTLFLVTACFGGLGGVLGMKVFHHKTQHWYFKVFFPVLLVVQIVLLAVGAYLLIR